MSNTWDFGSGDKGTGANEPPAAQTPSFGNQPPPYAQQPASYGPTSAGPPPNGGQWRPTPGQQGYGGPKPPSAQGLSIASMVLGIVSLVMFCFWPIALICAIIGLSLGGVAISKINSGSVSADGKGMAIAGVTCSLIGLAISVVLLIVVVANSGSNY